MLRYAQCRLMGCAQIPALRHSTRTDGLHVAPVHSLFLKITGLFSFSLHWFWPGNTSCPNSCCSIPFSKLEDIWDTEKQHSNLNRTSSWSALGHLTKWTGIIATTIMSLSLSSCLSFQLLEVFAGLRSENKTIPCPTAGGKAVEH